MQFITIKKLLVGTALTTALVACQATDGNTTQQAESNLANTKNALTLDRIYTDYEFRSDYIGQIRWLEDGTGYTSVEKSKTTKADDKGKQVPIGRDIVLYNPETLQGEVLVSAEQLTPRNTEKPLAIHDYIWSGDRKQLLIYTNSKKVWRSNSRGDYWVLNLSTNALVKLGGDAAKPSSLMFAKFSPDGTRVAYVRDDNIYVENLNDNSISQLTHDAGNGIINGLFDWVYEEEFSIRDGFRWSPDGKKIAFWQLDTSGSKDFIMINNTDALYPTITKFPYPKVGETNSLANIGIVDLASKKVTMTKLPNNSREMYIPRMNWAGTGEAILIQHVNRKQDTNILYLVNSQNAAISKIMVEQEETYLDFYDDAHWINDGKYFVWTSERSGWRDLYRISRDGKEVINLTPGNFDVTVFGSIQAIDEKGGWLYFTASKGNTSERYLYRSKLDGSVVNQRLTPKAFAGVNYYQMSPNGQWAVHSHSAFDQPTQKRLVMVANHQEKHMMMDNQKLIDKLATINKPSHEFFQVKARDGVVLDGYIMRPADFDPNKKYPIIFYVYSEPAGQTVQNRWRGNSYVWDAYMTEQGYIIASIDSRGAASPKGREWRKSIYGAVGILSSRDQADALDAMSKRWDYIDTDRVGIWGHSGGGSMTLNMLFRYPEQYHVGISLAPVPDQKLYDTIYQERYSGLLPDYEEGYKQGSPITHAKNLQGNLLLVHGTGDDNVHYQGAERLINELVKHNKQFEFMSYPNRSHSLREGKGTTLHLQTMKTQYFNRYLKNKQ
ncbi:S9 family peptidase [Thalassotalea sediminis]|uniref:S9 family peptidase n=1 Tax=Thalassotalea sediminis TaxID=1759089 RepID=UPI0025740B17|nr:S9 family peptidase [Thalassotalea sediminis]